MVLKTISPGCGVWASLILVLEPWAALWASPKVIRILKESYTLLFRNQPIFTRSPVVISDYGKPSRNCYLVETLIQKNVLEKVKNQTSMAFFNRLFFVPNPNKKWRPILGLSSLNKYLKSEIFKMETPETIMTSIQTWEWVMSTGFKDAYFRIPKSTHYRKYLCFHVQG